jgi:hypothetical protein
VAAGLSLTFAGLGLNIWTDELGLAATSLRLPPFVVQHLLKIGKIRLFFTGAGIKFLLAAQPQ